MDRETLRQYLGFYQDLGVDKLYLRQHTEQPSQTPMTPLPGLAPDNDTLFKILEDIGDCNRCRLHTSRNKIVFGTGNEQSKLVLVGADPHPPQDLQRLLFVC